MRRLLVVLAAISAGLASTSSAAASCAGPLFPGGSLTLQSQLDASPTVFVGTAIRTSNNDRVARVQVESVWKGSPIPTQVTVLGTPELGAAATSVDRTFKTGQKYLFVPISTSSPFQDNSCSATQPYSSQLASLMPATAQPPAAGSDGLDSEPGFMSPWLWIGPVLLILVLGGAAWILVRRRQRTPGT